VKQFSRDVVWNVASLAVAGACGIVLNYLIGLVYDEAALGVFNQVFAAYLLFSQLAALGIHHSTLQRVAAATDPDEQAAEATSALAVTLGVGALAALAFAACSPLVARVLASPEVGRGMRYAAPGVMCFALDKVCLSALNGLGRMRWYALLQGGRFVLLLAAFGGCVALGADRAVLPEVLTVAEAITLVASLIALGDLLARRAVAGWRARAREHLAFGVRGFMSGVLADLNTRVDVLMLGYFASDAVVGVFSFAAILAEGVFQILVALRTNYAPHCARLLAAGDRPALTALVRRGRNRIYLLAIPAAALAVLGYAAMGWLLASRPVIADSWPYFAILLAGMAAASGYVPFSTMLLYARRPGAYTWLTLGVVLVNVVANAILIPTLGPIGAPIATALAFVALAALSAATSRRLLDLPI
jgi:O-antigen/teichoic acid export membrane protein